MTFEILLFTVLLDGISALGCAMQHSSSDLDCNPYVRGELFLQCRISLHPDLHRGHCVSIEWHHTPFRHEDSSNQTKTDNSSIIFDHNFLCTIDKEMTLTNNTNTTVVDSTVKVYMLNQSHIGSYWCRVNISHPENPNNTIFSSAPVMLRSATAYSNLESCAPNQPQFLQKVKCDPPVATTHTTTPGTRQETTQMSSTLSHPSMVTSQQLAANSLPSTTAQSSPEGDDNTEDSIDNSMDDNDDNSQGRKHLKQFYIAVGVVGVFGSVIATLSLVVVCTCMKYRKMLKDKRKITRSQDSIRAPSTIPSDYLVPMTSQIDTQMSLTNTGSSSTINSSTGHTDNPTYIPTALIEQLMMSYSSNTNSLQLHHQHQQLLHQQPGGVLDQDIHYSTQHQFPQLHPLPTLDEQSEQKEFPLYATQFQKEFPLHSTQFQEFPQDQQRYEVPVPPPWYSGQDQLCVPLPQVSHEGAQQQRKSDVFLHSYESIKSPHDYEEMMESGNYENPLTMIKNDAYTSSNTYTNYISTD